MYSDKNYQKCFDLLSIFSVYLVDTYLMQLVVIYFETKEISAECTSIISLYLSSFQGSFAWHLTLNIII